MKIEMGILIGQSMTTGRSEVEAHRKIKTTEYRTLLKIKPILTSLIPVKPTSQIMDPNPRQV
jgi:hypothetical protein